VNIGICIGNRERLGDDYFYTETGIEEGFFCNFEVGRRRRRRRRRRRKKRRRGRETKIFFFRD